MREQTTQSTRSGRRGQSELVGIILLFGMVIAGAGLVFVAGSSAVDSFESSAEAGQVEITTDSASNQLRTAASDPDSVRSLPTDTAGQYQVHDDGEVQVGWHNESDGVTAIDWDPDENVSEPIELGALELRHEEMTYVHQGGSVWGVTDSGVMMHTPPDLGYDGEQPRLALMSIDDEGFDPADPTASYDPEATEAKMEKLNAITPHPHLEDFAVRVESEYAEGWETAFERQFDAENHQNVTVERVDDDVVVVTIEQLNDGFETGPIVVTADHGIEVPGGPDNTVSETEAIEVEAAFANQGPLEASTTPELVIHSGTGSTYSEFSSEFDLGGGDSTTWTLTVDNEDHPSWLDPGNEYEYDVRSGEMDSLDENGSFLYLHEDPHFEITELDTDRDDDSKDIDVTAEIRNVGDVDAIRDVSLALNHEDDAVDGSTTAALDLDRAVAKEVTWTINETRWPNGTYTAEVDTGDDHSTATIEVEDEGVQAVVIEEDLGIGGQGEPTVQEHDSFEVHAELNNTFTETETRDVAVEVYDEDGDRVEEGTEEDVSIHPDADGDDATIGVEIDGLAAGEYEYDITTGDDSLADRGEFLVTGQQEELEINNIVAVDVVDGDVVKPVSDLEDRTIGDLPDAGTLEITVAVGGGDDTEQFVWLEGFDGETVDIESVESAGGQVTLEWGDVTDPGARDNAEVAVETTRDRTVIDLDEEDVYEPRLDVTDLSFDPEPSEPGDTVAVEATVESVGGTAHDRQVGFDNQGPEMISGDSITVDGVTTLESEVTLEDDTFTQYVTADTGDDDHREALVVKRDGPACDADHVNYDGDNEISNVDELQCINNETHSPGLDADYELVDDIPAHGTQYWNEQAGFEPIGPEGYNYPDPDEFTYYPDPDNWETFGGTFDGNDFVISGLQIDRPSETFVGLFGATDHPWNDEGVGDGSTIENVRLQDIYVRGEQHVGGLVGQAGGTVIESRSTGHVEAEEQLVGGLIGDGVHADVDNELVAGGTVVGGKNVDGNNGEGIGGLIGRSTWETAVSTGYTRNMTVEYRPTSAPDRDSFTGGIVGTSSFRDSTFEQMYSVAEVDGHDDFGPGDDAGAIVGTVLDSDQGDKFKKSVYWNVDVEPDAKGVDRSTSATFEWEGRQTESMTGLGVTDPDRLGNLDFESDPDGGPWVAVPDDYPRFAWEAPEYIEYEVSHVAAENRVTAGETVDVDFVVERESQNVQEGQETVTLLKDGDTVDTQEVTLEHDDDTATGTVQWRTHEGIVSQEQDFEVTVRIGDDEANDTVTVEPIDRGPGDAGDAEGGGFETEFGTGDSGSFDPGSSVGEADLGAETEIDIDVIGVA